MVVVVCVLVGVGGRRRREGRREVNEEWRFRRASCDRFGSRKKERR